MHNGILITATATAIAASSPILMAGAGELLAETLGIFNIGIEGSMLFGAFLAVVLTHATGNVWLGVLAGAGAGAVSSALFGLGVVRLEAELVLSGLALVFIATGVTGVTGNGYIRIDLPAAIPTAKIPLLQSIPYVGPILFRQPVLVYVALLAPVAVWLLLYHTAHGLDLRAIGEDPTSADAAGVNVNRLRLAYITIGGAFAGVGGAILSLSLVGTWLQDITAGLGYVALAAVMVAGWRPLALIPAALMFGALGTLGDVAQAYGWSVPSALLSALPYIGTLLLVCGTAWVRTRRSGRPPWPAALGESFSRQGMSR
jgi:simple sugar transport system permease protein